jgi:hypothetical protein
MIVLVVMELVPVVLAYELTHVERLVIVMVPHSHSVIYVLIVNVQNVQITQPVIQISVQTPEMLSYLFQAHVYAMTSTVVPMKMRHVELVMLTA